MANSKTIIKFNDTTSDCQSGGKCQHWRVEERAITGEWRRVSAMESGGEGQQRRAECGESDRGELSIRGVAYVESGMWEKRSCGDL